LSHQPAQRTASPAIIEVAEEPIRELQALRSIDPPAALVARVMTRVSDPATLTLWQWLSRPVKVEIRVSPLGVLLTGVIVAAGIALVFAR
jgi:hypothetical protein